MSFITQTQTVTATTTALISATSPKDVTITVTSHLYTTVPATPGQTVTMFSLLPPSPSSPTTKYTPVVATTIETSTVTVTKLDVYLQNTQGSLYSTWVLSLSAPQSSGTSTGAPSPFVYVVEPQERGWDSWSKGAKAGLIVGVVLAALLLLGMLLCCCKRRNMWFVHGWPWSAPVPPQPSQGPSVVQPTFVNGPLMPYNHGQPTTTYGYGYAQGLRGGGGPGRYFSGSYREWFRKKQNHRGE